MNKHTLMVLLALLLAGCTHGPTAPETEPRDMATAVECRTMVAAPDSTSPGGDTLRVVVCVVR